MTKLKAEIKIFQNEGLHIKTFILISFKFILFFVSSTSLADPGQIKPLRHVRLHGSINKITVEYKNNQVSVKTALAPKSEKVCDISLKIPVYGGTDGELTNSSTCSTQFGGKPANIFLASRMYVASAMNGKANSKKGADLILFVESPLLEANSFSAGTEVSKNVSQINLRLNTPTYINNVNSNKIQESFSVDVTFDDPGK